MDFTNGSNAGFSFIATGMVRGQRLSNSSNAIDGRLPQSCCGWHGVGFFVNLESLRVLAIPRTDYWGRQRLFRVSRLGPSLLSIELRVTIYPDERTMKHLLKHSM